MTKNLDKEGLSSIVDNYQLFYVDLWGVVHNGVSLHHEAIKAIKEISKKWKDYILLTNVKGAINFIDYNLIEISSDFGKYNVNNYDTIFSKNVIITYLDNTIKGEYLDFSWDRNLMIISKNVILENSKSSLKSDVIEVDISTKKIKIFMYEENKKVNIKTLN